MEKVRRAYNRDYPVLRLYLDDVEELMQLIKKYYSEVSVIIDDFVINDNVMISDIKKKVVSSLTIQCQPHYDKDSKVARGRIALELMQSYARVYMANDADPFLLGIASQIDTILMRRKSRLDFFTSTKTIVRAMVAASILALVSGLASVFSSKTYVSSPLSITEFLGLMLFMTIGVVSSISWTAWANYVRSKRYCLIYLINYNAKSNFFVRQKDQIILLLIGAVIGSVVTVLVNWIAGFIHV